MHKHILITSIPSWNQKSGSNTFSSLFNSFDSSDLANIYISGQLPDSNVCSRYFHIDEISVVKSVLQRNLLTGHEVFETTDTSISEPSKKKNIKRYRIFLWIRELAWKLGKWKSRELDAFLDDFHPDVLVFPIESYPYFNCLNQYIIERCRPQKVIGYLWDDNFTYKQHPHSIIFKVERFFLRKQVKKLVASCTTLLAISPKMKEECDKELGVNSIVLTKPIFDQGEFKEFEVNNPVRILYTGKLIIGRYETIAKVAAAIKEINKDGQRVILDVYTQTLLSEKMRQRIDIPGCCVLHDPVLQSEVFRLQKEADVLLFAESLSDRDLTARLSFSTKLTDYFTAGKCVWGVGNADLGPIDYIKSENAGFVSSDDTEIMEVLTNIVSNPNLVCEKAELGYQCGLRNHNYKSILKMLDSVISNPIM